MDSELTTYTVYPSYKKSTYSHEYWENNICGKKVLLKITVVWRWGEFNIDIYKKEKEELLKTEDIIINDHCGEFISTTDGCERITEIIDIDKYSEEEKKEIYKVVYEDDEDEIVYDESVLEEEYDWVLDDTIYEIVGGFTLEEE